VRDTTRTHTSETGRTALQTAITTTETIREMIQLNGPALEQEHLPQQYLSGVALAGGNIQSQQDHLRSQLDRPSAFYGAATAAATTTAVDEDRQSISEEKGKGLPSQHDQQDAQVLNGSSAHSHDSEIYLADKVSPSTISSAEFHLQTDEQIKKSYAMYDGQLLSSASGAAPCAAQAYNLVAGGMGPSGMNMSGGESNKFNLREPLPSGQFTISSQHPQVIIPSSTIKTTPDNTTTAVFQATKLAQCREQLDFDFYDYMDSPDSVLNPKLTNRLPSFIAANERQGRNMMQKFGPPQGGLLPENQRIGGGGGAGGYGVPLNGEVKSEFPLPGNGGYPSLQQRPNAPALAANLFSEESYQQNASFNGGMRANGGAGGQLPPPLNGYSPGSLGSVMLSQVFGSQQPLQGNVAHKRNMFSANGVGGNDEAFNTSQHIFPGTLQSQVRSPILVPLQSLPSKPAMKSQKKGGTPRKSSGPKKSKVPADRQRTSQHRGVSRHRLTKRWEASCWVNKRQLYLGGFDSEEKAARAYDVAALVCKGLDAPINFDLNDYVQHIQMLRHCTQEELVAHLRRQSSAFSRGKSKYRGVSGHDKRWEARIGQYSGRKNVSFGVYELEEEAARQYDRALIIQRGRSAKTNFNIFSYKEEIAEYEVYIQSLPAKNRNQARKHTTLPLSLSQKPGGLSNEAKLSKKRGSAASAVIYAEQVKRALLR